MKSIPQVVLLCSLMSLSFCADCHAEKITLKSGLEVYGEIIERATHTIKVKLADGKINTYLVYEIKNVEADQKKVTKKAPSKDWPSDDPAAIPGPAFGMASRMTDSSTAFPALHHDNKAVSLGLFTGAGPDENSLQPVNNRLRHVAYDPAKDVYYALTSHDLGVLDPTNFKFNKIEYGESLGDVSWPGGIAFDVARQRVVFTGSSGAGQDIFAYQPESNEWQAISSNRHTGEGVIAYCSDSDTLYALPNRKHGKGISELFKINSKGAIIKTVPLSPTIPFFGGTDSSLQMACHQERLYVLAHQRPHPRLSSPMLYQVDPTTGKLEVAPYSQGVNLVEQLWPGMPEGPPSSEEVAGVCQSGPYSHYATPEHLIKKRIQELHVVATVYGDVNVWKELQRVKSLKVDSEGVELALDLRRSATGVEVRVEKTAAPVVLVLFSPDNQYSPHTLIWNLEVAGDARLEKVLMIESEHQKLVGLPEGVPVETVAVGLDGFSKAWEIEENERGEFDTMIKDVRKRTGLRESSFQGCSYGKSFIVPPHK